MNPAIIAHSLVAADERRVRDFADLYARLETAVASAGVQGAVAKAAHRTLCARIAGWEVGDLEAERRDVVTLACDERDALVRGIARVLPYAKRSIEGLHPAVQEEAVIQSLERICGAFPETLPRATIVQLRRSTARLARLEELRGPLMILANEAEIMLEFLESATAPIQAPEIAFDSDDGFHETLRRGLKACVLRETGAAGSKDLGLGSSAILPGLLGVSGMDLQEVHDRWLDTAAPTHPWARHPYVPRGRFGSMKLDRIVRSDLEDTGPIGWAAGHDLKILSDELRAVAGSTVDASVILCSVANHVRQVAERSQAIVGFIEFLPPEAEGRRQWLVDPEDK